MVKFKLSIDIDLSIGFPISIFIDWLPRVLGSQTGNSKGVGEKNGNSEVNDYGILRELSILEFLKARGEGGLKYTCRPR